MEKLSKPPLYSKSKKKKDDLTPKFNLSLLILLKHIKAFGKSLTSTWEQSQPHFGV